MERFGRAPAPPAIEAGKGRQVNAGDAMSHHLNNAVAVERSFFWQPGLAQAIDNSSATVTDEQRREFKEKSPRRRCKRAQADLDWRPHHPRQDIEAGQPLPAPSIRPSSVGRADQATELGASRAQALDRGREEAVAPQCSCDRACQQTGQDCLERSGSWPKLRGEAGHGVSRLVCVKN